MNIPTKEECYSLIEKYRVPKNVRAHIEQVTKIAVFLAKSLNEKGIAVNVQLVEAGGLLHDVVKAIDFVDFYNESLSHPLTLEEAYFFSSIQDRFPDMKHEDAAYVMFADDYPDLARLIRKHGYKNILEQALLPFTWEEKVLTYADKRVAHDKIVTLKERFEEGHLRYNTNSSMSVLSKDDLDRIDSEYFKLEKEIFGIIGINPDKIAEFV
jgi:uncharacterized protein